MSNTNQRSRFQRIVISVAAALGGLAIGFLLARAIGEAPVFTILAVVALWAGLTQVSRNAKAKTADQSAVAETLASL